MGSDSTNWPNLSDNPKVFASASTSSAASSMNSASMTEASDSQESPMLHRPKLSQNGRELAVGKNNHTYQNTNLISTGKCSSKLSSSIGVAIDSTSTSILGGNPLSCKSSRVSALSFDGTVSYENLNMD